MSKRRRTILAKDLTREHIGQRFHFGFWCWEDYFEGEGALTELEWTMPYFFTKNGEKCWHQDGTSVSIELEDGDDWSGFCLHPTDVLEIR